jgi:hypothetical protein
MRHCYLKMHERSGAKAPENADLNLLEYRTLYFWSPQRLPMHMNTRTISLMLAIVTFFGGLSAPALTVSVLPFESKNLHKAEDQGLRDFEKLYFSYRLVKSLNNERGIRAYFSPVATPATDITIIGRINESNGRKTSVSLKIMTPDGRTIDNDDYGILISSRDFASQTDPANKLWIDCASAISEKANKVLNSLKIASERVGGYEGVRVDDDSPAQSSKSIAMASAAGGIEIDRVLEPMTEKIMEDGEKLNNYYITWQERATPIVEERSRAKVNFWLGELSIIGGAAAATMSAQHGVSNPMAGTTVAQGAFEVSMSANDMHECDLTLSALKGEIAYGTGREITVTFYDHVYHLTGTSAEQLAQFRDVVKQRLGRPIRLT